MVVHIAECVLGVFAFDENGKMLSFKAFPWDIVEAAGRIASMQMGTPTPEHRELIPELIGLGHDKFTLESEQLVARMREEFKQTEFKFQLPNKGGEVLRSKLHDIARQLGFDNIDEFVRDVNLLLTRDKLRIEAAERDKLIVQAINMLDEIDKTANIISAHIREWYSIHFPELDKLLFDPLTYLKLVAELGSREKFTEDAIAMMVPDVEKIEKISVAAKNSLGASFDELDIGVMQECAKEVMAMYRVREQIAEYIDGLMAQIAPNIRTVAGSSIGARLISLAGSLEKLARLPASTVQILGAEKALFRAIRSRSKPPKHGVIYQHPEIRGAPRKQRGKIARALAGKLTIAARVDAMSGEFVGDKLEKELRTRIVEIKTKYEMQEK